MTVFAGRQVSHWDFPRSTVSVALMTEFGCDNGLVTADVLKDSGLTESDLRDPTSTIVGRQELAVATNLVDLLGDPADLGIRVGSGYHVGSMGIFGFACLTSSTLGDAVRFAARCYELSYGFCLPSVTVEGPVLFSSDWYPALACDNVDVIIYGTGFKATEFLAPITVSGRDGRSLQSVWAEGARAHLGMAVPGFPNLFLIYGPNTNLGRSSIILMMEQQARYIRQLVEELIRSGRRRAFEVRPEVEQAYDIDVQTRLDNGVWTTCDSWYRTESGRVTTNWPGLVHEYRRRTTTVTFSDYRQVVLTSIAEEVDA